MARTTDTAAEAIGNGWVAAVEMYAVQAIAAAQGEMLVRDDARAVSYTHLTLPTTPYV